MNRNIQTCDVPTQHRAAALPEWSPLPLLEQLAAYGPASKLKVFGSVARGDAAPRDLDLVFCGNGGDWEALVQEGNLNRLLSLARLHYGRLDVFVLAGNRLYVRSDDASTYVIAKNSALLRSAIKADALPLLDVLARLTAGLSPRSSGALVGTAVDTVCAKLRLPRLAAVELLTLPVDALRQRDREVVVSNGMSPADFARYEMGAAKIGAFNTHPSESYVEYLAEFDSSSLLLAECVGHIKSHVTYPRYLEMRKQGFEPPYVLVCGNEKGQLISSNRRRTLVAQELKLPLNGWYSPHNHDTGLPLKYRDVLAEYVRALTPVINGREQAMVC